MKRNTWQARFGAKRRALDCKLLAEAEKAIGQDNATQRPPMTQQTAAFERLWPDDGPSVGMDEQSRIAIARAFGRPLDVMGPPSVLPEDD